MAKYQSPTFDLVIRKFEEKLRAHEAIDSELCDRLIEAITKEEALTVQRIIDALFPSSHEEPE